MIDFSELGTIWNIIEPIVTILTIVFSLAIYFRDPLRRWRFFGYRPTAIMVIYDPQTMSVLLIKSNQNKSFWHFSQGGIYTSEINTTIEEIIRRELGIKPGSYRLRYIEEIGTIKIKNRERSQRDLIGFLSIRRKIQGKGYIACYIQADLEKIKKEIKAGYATTETKIFSVDEAKKLFESKLKTAPDMRVKKLRLLIEILEKVENDVKNGEGNGI